MKTLSGANVAAFVCPALPRLFHAGSEGPTTYTKTVDAMRESYRRDFGREIPER
jgi:hypothetical protein